MDQQTAIPVTSAQCGCGCACGCSAPAGVDKEQATVQRTTAYRIATGPA